MFQSLFLLLACGAVAGIVLPNLSNILNALKGN